MIWGKFPALDSKHSCSALQARGVREWNTRHLYLMISIYQQEQSQDVGSDLIPCSPVFTWGTHAHVFSSPRHYHTPLFHSHPRADNTQQPPDSAVQAVPHLLTATQKHWDCAAGETVRFVWTFCMMHEMRINPKICRRVCVHHTWWFLFYVQKNMLRHKMCYGRTHDTKLDFASLESCHLFTFICCTCLKRNVNKHQ